MAQTDQDSSTMSALQTQSVTGDEKFVQFLSTEITSETDELHVHEKIYENPVNWKDEMLTGLVKSLALQRTEGVKFDQLLDEKMIKVPVNWTTGVKKDLELLTILNVGFPT